MTKTRRFVDHKNIKWKTNFGYATLKFISYNRAFHVRTTDSELLYFCSANAGAIFGFNGSAQRRIISASKTEAISVAQKGNKQAFLDAIE